MTRAEPPSTPRFVQAAILLLFVAIAIVTYLRADPAASLSTDQVNIGTIFLKEQHPEAMPRDFVYGDPQNFRFYTPAYRSLVRLFISIGGSYEAALHGIVPFMVFLFLAGMYLLVRSATGSIAAALMTSLAAMTLRYSLAAEIWGVGSIRFVVPGSVYLSIAPFLVLMMMRWGGGRLAWPAFLVLGLSANLHPISGMALIESYLLLVLIEGRFRGAAWRKAVLCGLAAGIGSAPFAARYLALTRTATPVDPAQVLAGIDFRLNNLFLFKKLAWVVRAVAGMAIPAVLAFVGWRAMRRMPVDSARHLDAMQRIEPTRPVDSARHATLLLAAIAIVSIGGSLLIELLMAITKHPPFLVDQLRGAKYLYLPIFILCGHGFAALLRARRRAIAAAFLLALQFSAPIHLPDKPDFGFDTLRRETRFPGRGEIPWLEKPTPIPPDAVDLAAWARAETAPDAVFHGGDELFRYRAARGITVTFKDGGFLFYANRPRFVEWYRKMLETDRARQDRDLAVEAALAREYGANYLIVRSSRTGGGNAWITVYESASYRVYDLRRDPS
jgi:hypothetical protein